MTAPVTPVIPGLTYVRPLGSGGFCDVLLYEQEQPRMKVAVKVLTAPGLSEDRRRQFTAEGDAMALLSDHPYIVPVFRAGLTERGQPFLIMQYYPDANLAQRARHERIPVADALRIGIQIASAVETAHRSGILHRDVKPANILGGPYGNPGLTDFGVAAAIADTAAAAEGLSVPWAPPEVLLESGPPDVSGDVYSLAATIWHLLAGRSPFEVPDGDNSTAALSARIISDSPSPTGRADVPESLDRLLMQAMAKNPLLRPSSAAALARGLQRIEQEQRLALTQLVVPSGARLAEAAATASSTRIRTSVPHPDSQDVAAVRPVDDRPQPARRPEPAGPITPPAPVYAQWPPPPDDWSPAVLSTPVAAAPTSYWPAHRTEILAAAVGLAVLILVVVALLLR